MPYRNLECDIHLPKRDMNIAATEAEFRVTNGTISYLAIPCFYVEILPPIEAPHCRDWHDHIGWPSPSHPDHICQERDFHGYHYDRHHSQHTDTYLDMQRVFPIHFLDEGYESCRIICQYGVPDGFEAEASFDEDRDWIIRLTVSANMFSAQETAKIIKFSIFADGYNNGHAVSNIVQRGHFVVMPAIVL